MDGWDVAILAVAGYLAVTGLVRLMLVHRDRMLAQFRSQMEQQRKEPPPKPVPPEPKGRNRAA